jgi:heptosyltransferase I
MLFVGQRANQTQPPRCVGHFALTEFASLAMSRRVSSFHRLLDRVVGIPLVATLSLAPKRRMPNPASIRRIGVLKTAAIGDTLLLAGVLRAIRAEYPKATVVLITGTDNASAAALFDDAVDEHVVIQPRTPIAAIIAVRRLRLDIMLDYGPWPRFDALLAALSHAKYRVGFRVPGQARHFGFDCVVEHASTVHELENLQNLARAIAVTRFDAPSLRAPGCVAHDRFSERHFAVFHPWSGGYMGRVKEWRDDRWVELAAELYRRRGLRILVSGSANDVDRSVALVRRMNSARREARSIAGEYSLVELADVLSASDVVVSVNTGVMHLAALLGAPTVSLEGPVALHRWRPIGPHVRSVVSEFAGSGYLSLGFEYAHHRLDCMDGVDVSGVVAAVDELLDSISAERSPRSPRVSQESTWQPQ